MNRIFISYTVLVLLALNAFLFFGCQNEHNHSVKQFQTNVDDIHANADTIFKGTQLISLEFNNQAVINNINKVIVDDENIILFDRRMKQVLIYDTTGTHKSTIKRIGRGPYEYQYLRDFLYDRKTEQVGLLTSGKGSLLWFNLEGKPVSSKSISRKKLLLDNGFLWKDKIYHFNHNPKFNKDHFQFNITDRNLHNIEGSYFKTNTTHISRLHMHPFGVSNGNVSIHFPYDYWLYEIQNKRPVKVAQFDFGKANIPEPVLEKMLLEKNNLTQEQVINSNKAHADFVKVNLVVPLRDYILLGCNYQFQPFYVLINKKTNDTRAFRGIYKKMSLGSYVGCKSDENIVYFEIPSVRYKILPETGKMVKVKNGSGDLQGDVSKMNPGLLEVRF